MGVTTAQADPGVCGELSRSGVGSGVGGAEPPALEETFEEDFRAIASYLRRRTGDAELARELASETYVHAMMSLSGWRDKGLPMRCWLLRIATRRLAHHRRRERVRSVGLLRLWGQRPARARTPVEMEESGVMRRAIAALPRAQQDVLMLHHVEGLSVERVAVVLEVPVGTVKSRLGRGRAALARLLDGVLGEEGGL